MGSVRENKSLSQLNQKVDFLFHHKGEFWDSDPGFSQDFDTAPTASFLITGEFALSINSGSGTKTKTDVCLLNTNETFKLLRCFYMPFRACSVAMIKCPNKSNLTEKVFVMTPR